MLVGKRSGWQDNTAGVSLWRVKCFFERQLGALVFFGNNTAVDVAAANSELQNDWCVTSFGELEASFDRIDHAFEVGARVEQPNLRFHGKSVGTLLHNGRAFAVVFANNYKCATFDPTRS